ncbi:MAG TPA: integrase [Algoriphagus sp.]|jgi:integrase/recombinase XerC|uniref:tyrosine-type recombinase/integrase n=1 Tax=unclassified Algoriphagus TaxID=2641541 RepID=UPI000C52E314|nr:MULTISPECIES: tyrosine-type recombinase/integrase [unclassified Algoriphagus]MAL13630.1 integrase [Algoriphagus sp.]MAN86099.1 integrase [Algoriphagus sp.]HAD53496.1 integrase [Algoriphagus sp.]HAH37760.1 integrase [Algoriphagus sp.]HAS58339.1 integrase [Algoriphagus sp.]|tara:strand:+ start:5695 stop:6579 length:885 start_codon:yes stop_codon:yes gene_type:complete
MINSFVNYLEYEKRSSPHTVEAYERDLRQFEDFVKLSFELNKISEASHSEIRAWVIDLVEQGLSSTSVNRKIATLRSYYKFLLRTEVITQDPTYKLKSLKNPKKLPEFVQENSIASVLEESVYESGFEGQRDRMVMEFLYLTGVRLSELIGLKWEDIHLGQEQVKVLGKRKKERIIPITKGLKQNILSYQKVFEERFPKAGQSHYFIVSNSGAKSYPMMIYRIVRQYLDRFAQTSKRSPHILRHTFATHLLNKGADLNAVKDLLGHANLAATQVYTHNSMEKLKAVFEQAHPKA